MLFKKCVLLVSTLLSTIAIYASSQTITGAGSTFIYPVFVKWTQSYAQKTQQQINYQAIGSGGGISQLQNGIIKFAATDMPLSSPQLKKNAWWQFPIVSGAIVPITHIAGIEKNQLILSGKLLADIYLGHIQYWDDPAITQLNPTLSLPHQQIISIHRSDGSGTTFNFTYYLAQVNPEWQQKVGVNTLVAWPSLGLGAQGNAGVAAMVKQTPNSLGYVEYAYAKQNNLASARMINQAGHTVSPSPESFNAAANHAHWDVNNDFNLVLTNQPGDNSWPIIATTFILLPKNLDPALLTILTNFFEWVFVEGADSAKQLDFVPISTAGYTTALELLKH